MIIETEIGKPLTLTIRNGQVRIERELRTRRRHFTITIADGINLSNQLIDAIEEYEFFEALKNRENGL